GVPIARADDGLTAEQVLGGPVPSGGPRHHTAVVELVRAGYPHIDWAALSAPGARITDLPTYPFAAQKHWQQKHWPTRGEGPAESEAGRHPKALRVQWEVDELPRPTGQVERASVHIVTTDTALRNALTAALRDRGAAIEEAGLGADTLVVVHTADPQADGSHDLSAFWAELGAHIAALPAHGKLIRAGYHGVAVHAAERGRLRPEAAASHQAPPASGRVSPKHSQVLEHYPAGPAEVQARPRGAQ
ncbi:hypothetical protein ACWGJZ_42280, partial [Streptomyces rimosus]